MDVEGLSDRVVQALGVHLPDLITGRAEGARDQARLLWETLRPRLEAGPAAWEAVQAAARDSQDSNARATLRRHLAQLFQEDAELAKSVAALLVPTAGTDQQTEMQTEGGDHLTVGNIDRSSGIAIGAGAQAMSVRVGSITLTPEALALLQKKDYTPPPPPPAGELPAPGALPPGSRLPHPRNAVFTGREADLLALGEALLRGDQGALASKLAQGITQPAAATGRGGTGKTQLAVELCYRYGRFFMGVHWVQANQDLVAEMAACGQAMGLLPWPEKAPEQAQATLAAWQRGGPGGATHLIVLDNLEDPQVLADWLPVLGKVSILATSRRAEWPPDLGVVTHRLGVLEREESVGLLRKLAPRHKSAEAELEQVAERLGDLPLALDLAGRYLQERPELGVAEYLAELEAEGNLLEHTSLLDWTEHSPTQHETNVAATFLLS